MVNQLFLKNKIFDKYIKLSLDSIKEGMFDSYYKVMHNKRMNKKSKYIFNKSTFHIFWILLEELMSKSLNCVLDYPFNKKTEPTFNKLIKKYGYEEVLVIILYVPPKIRFQRRINRIKNKTRHKGHHNSNGEKNFLKSLEKNAISPIIIIMNIKKNILKNIH